MSEIPLIGDSPADYEAIIKALPENVIDEGLQFLSGFSSIQKSEQEQIEEIIALLPKPWLDPIAFNNLALHIHDFFGVGGVSTTSSDQTVLDSSESAIVLSGLMAWLKSEDAKAEEVRNKIRNDPNNPIQVALEAYVARGVQPININPQDLQTLQQSPILHTTLRGVGSSLLMKSLQIAQQELILSLLDKWVQAEQERAEKQREEERIKDLKELSPTQRMIQDYLRDVESGRIVFSAPVLSALIVNMTYGPVLELVDSKNSVQGLTATASLQGVLPNLGQNIPPELQGPFAFLGTGYANLASYWCIPGAFSMIGDEISPSEKTMSSAAVRAYAITLTQFVLSPDFDKIVAAVVARSRKDISPEHLASFSATLRIALLSNALAAIEQTETGKFIGASIRALIEGRVNLEEGSLQAGLVKLIQEQSEHLLPEARSSTFAALYAYFDTPGLSLSRLTDPAKAFLSLWDPRYFHETNIANQA